MGNYYESAKSSYNRYYDDATRGDISHNRGGRSKASEYIDRGAQMFAARDRNSMSSPGFEMQENFSGATRGDDRRYYDHGSSRARGGYGGEGEYYDNYDDPYNERDRTRGERQGRYLQDSRRSGNNFGNRSSRDYHDEHDEYGGLEDEGY